MQIGSVCSILLLLLLQLHTHTVDAFSTLSEVRPNPCSVAGRGDTISALFPTRKFANRQKRRLSFDVIASILVLRSTAFQAGNLQRMHY